MRSDGSPASGVTASAEALGVFLRERGISIQKAAKELKTTRTVFYYWLHGVQRPRPELREQIERWTGSVVKASGWFTIPEQEQIEATRPHLDNAEPAA